MGDGPAEAYSTSSYTGYGTPQDRRRSNYGTAGTAQEDILTEAAASKAEDRLLQDAYNRDILTNMLLSAGGQALQYRAMKKDTAQDVRNKEQLARLKRLEAQGRLGLSGRERRQAEATMLSPVRALATEDRRRAESRLATMGNQTSAADLDRVERQASDRAQQQGLAAGMQISQMHLEKAAQQLNELEERTAYEAERTKGQREFIAQSLGQLGGIAGQAMASRAVPKLNIDDIPADQRTEIVELLLEASADPNPLSRARKMKMLEAYLGGSDPNTMQTQAQDRSE